MTRLSNLAYHSKYHDTRKAMPDITLFFLQASRAIRPAWALQELGLDYQIEFSERQDKVKAAPPEFKQKSGNPLGKFPTLKDGDLLVHESGAIVEYLIDNYDKGHKLLPADKHLRSRTQVFIHAAEGTFMLHGLAILYARWQFPRDAAQQHPEILNELEEKLSVNVQKDFDWLEQELGQSTGQFLVGNQVTAADIMVQFSIEFLLERGLGTKGKSWPKINAWNARCKATETFKAAAQKTGHTLNP